LATYQAVQQFQGNRTGIDLRQIDPMRIALLGHHPDGIALAGALVRTGRHQLVSYSGPRNGTLALEQLGIAVKPVGDMEESLADPAVEAVIVAGRPGDRAVQLRRALQSERHVLCVHPADASPDIAYEAALIQSDTRQMLMPILPDALHPGVVRLADLIRQPDGPIGRLILVAIEESASGPALLDTGVPGTPPGIPGWTVVRALGGEVAEVSAFAPGEELPTDQAVLVAGRFESGGMFQVTLLPGQSGHRRVIRVWGTRGTAELALELTGGSTLLRHGEHIDRFESWDPLTAIVEVVEAVTLGRPGNTRHPVWQDEVRCLELDDAVRRSIERRRVSALEYPEVSEEVGFKGTMTLIGCGLLWTILGVVILAAWDRRFLWVVIPLLAGFLALQMLRWLIPARDSGTGTTGEKLTPRDRE
jgi:predicted dehydrogenase